MVAETEPLARRAAKAVTVEYEDLPAIISIEDAIEAGSYYEQYHGDSLVSGDLEAGFAGRECVQRGAMWAWGRSGQRRMTNSCTGSGAEAVRSSIGGCGSKCDGEEQASQPPWQHHRRVRLIGRGRLHKYR